MHTLSDVYYRNAKPTTVYITVFQTFVKNHPNHSSFPVILFFKAFYLFSIHPSFDRGMFSVTNNQIWSC